MIRTMKIQDFEEMMALWVKTPGIGLNEADTYDKVQAFLERNKSMSFVAETRGKIIATIMCGHDGRRGYIYHLAVEDSERNQGLGKLLTSTVMSALRIQGIEKCHLFVQESNHAGRQFWNKNEWEEREDLVLCSRSI